MPDPQDKNGVQRFLGMINYLSPQKASLTDPLRQIIKDNAPWNWGQQQSEAMEKLKKILSSGIVLKYYDDKKPLVIKADASNSGLGACLLQDSQPICYAARLLTDTETRYAQIDCWLFYMPPRNSITIYME